MIEILFIILGTALRILPHPANFSPLVAIALFGGTYLKKTQALTIPLLIMIISDLILGIHPLIFWTWGSFILISFLSLWLKKHPGLFNLGKMTVLSSLLFFLITNFGVWLSTSWYPHTVNGLLTCYLAGIPFFKISFLGDLLYTTLLFSAYFLIQKAIKHSLLPINHH